VEQPNAITEATKIGVVGATKQNREKEKRKNQSNQNKIPTPYRRLLLEKQGINPRRQATAGTRRSLFPKNRTRLIHIGFFTFIRNLLTASAKAATFTFHTRQRPL